MRMTEKNGAGILRTIHKHDDGSYEVCIKKGDIEHKVTEPTLKAATERLEYWYESLVNEGG